MTALIGYLLQALAVLGNILGITTAIQALLGKVVQEHLPYLVENTVVSTSINVAHPTYGLSAAHTERLAILSAIEASRDAILAAVGDPTQVPTPPAWYTAPQDAPAGTYGVDIMGYMIGGTESFENFCVYMELLGANINLYAALPAKGNPLFAVEMPWKYPPD